MSGRSATEPNRPFTRREGRLFGGLLLLAFVLYGVGTALGSETLGFALVAANSVAVTVVGVLGLRLLGNQDPKAGIIYLIARIAEAVLLAGGFALHAFADVSGADNTGYLLGMAALGLGSVPFWRAVQQRELLSSRLALWGIAGYVALAIGAIAELATGRGLAVAFAIPGGLFELVVGIILLRKGFASPSGEGMPVIGPEAGRAGANGEMGLVSQIRGAP